jgi:hypothetical protein
MGADMTKKVLLAIGYAAIMVGHALMELVMAIHDDPKMPEQERTARPHD